MQVVLLLDLSAARERERSGCLSPSREGTTFATKNLNRQNLNDLRALRNAGTEFVDSVSASTSRQVALPRFEISLYF